MTDLIILLDLLKRELSLIESYLTRKERRKEGGRKKERESEGGGGRERGSQLELYNALLLLNDLYRST